MANFGEQPTSSNRERLSSNAENAENNKKQLTGAVASGEADNIVELAGQMKDLQGQAKEFISQDESEARAENIKKQLAEAIASGDADKIIELGGQMKSLQEQGVEFKSQDEDQDKNKEEWNRLRAEIKQLEKEGNEKKVLAKEDEIHALEKRMASSPGRKGTSVEEIKTQENKEIILPKKEKPVEAVVDLKSIAENEDVQIAEVREKIDGIGVESSHVKVETKIENKSNAEKILKENTLRDIEFSFSDSGEKTAQSEQIEIETNIILRETVAKFIDKLLASREDLAKTKERLAILGEKIIDGSKFLWVNRRKYGDLNEASLNSGAEILKARGDSLRGHFAADLARRVSIDIIGDKTWHEDKRYNDQNRGMFEDVHFIDTIKVIAKAEEKTVQEVVADYVDSFNRLRKKIKDKKGFDKALSRIDLFWDDKRGEYGSI